jgi:hypothetical protein
VFEGLEFAGALPKLYVAAVNELFGGFLGGIIVRAVEFDWLHDAPV